MVKPYDSATQTLLDSGELEDRELIAVDMPEGKFGFWNDIANETFSSFPGFTFTGSAGLISVTNVTQTIQSSIQSLTAILSGLDAAALASVGTYNLHRATKKFAKVLIDPATKSVVNVVTLFQGYINKDTFSDNGETCTLTLECYSRSKEFDGASNRVRSNTDQKRRDATDKFNEFTQRTGVSIVWGKRAVVK